MNYRHAFHAGNFADVVKHIILTRVIAYMQRKDAGIAMIDTHAGIGRYDLGSDQALRTGEAKGGITAFFEAQKDAPAELRPLIALYVDIVLGFNEGSALLSYPGSPRIMHAMRRHQDRLSLMELHESDHAALAREFAGAHGVKTHKLDGWMALKAQLPPKERRGIVLIDPPYEARDEFDAVLGGLSDALRRFATGTYCVWFPLKHEAATDAFEQGLRQLSVEVLITELRIRQQTKADGTAALFGTGMAIINPPFVLESELQTILPWLVSALEDQTGTGSFRLAAYGA